MSLRRKNILSEHVQIQEDQELLERFKNSQGFFEFINSKELEGSILYSIIASGQFSSKIQYGWTSDSHPLWIYFLSKFSDQEEIWSLRINNSSDNIIYPARLYPISTYSEGPLKEREHSLSFYRPQMTQNYNDSHIESLPNPCKAIDIQIPSQHLENDLFLTYLQKTLRLKPEIHDGHELALYLAHCNPLMKNPLPQLANTQVPRIFRQT